MVPEEAKREGEGKTVELEWHLSVSRHLSYHLRRLMNSSYTILVAALRSGSLHGYHLSFCSSLS